MIFCMSLVKSNTQSSNQKRRIAMFKIPKVFIKVVKEVVKVIVGVK